MIARAGAAPPAQAPLVLKNVMADLMREDMAEHEALQRIARPGQDRTPSSLRSAPASLSIARSFFGSAFGRRHGGTGWS